MTLCGGICVWFLSRYRVFRSTADPLPYGLVKFKVAWRKLGDLFLVVAWSNRAAATRIRRFG